MSAKERNAEQPRIVFEVQDVRAGYGSVPVLHGVSFSLQEGDALGVVGHNGMGKSTLLKALMGLLPLTSGKIMLDGVDATHKRRIFAAARASLTCRRAAAFCRP